MGQTLRIDYGTFWHYGLYAGNNQVIHNSKKFRGVVVSSLQEFEDGRKIEISNIGGGCGYSAVAKAKELIGLHYNLFLENCENFVRYCHGLCNESTQITRAILGATGTTMALSAPHPVLKAAGGAIAVGSLLFDNEDDVWQTEYPRLGIFIGAVSLIAIVAALSSK